MIGNAAGSGIILGEVKEVDGFSWVVGHLLLLSVESGFNLLLNRVGLVCGGGVPISGWGVCIRGVALWDGAQLGEEGAA